MVRISSDGQSKFMALLRTYGLSVVILLAYVFLSFSIYMLFSTSQLLAMYIANIVTIVISLGIMIDFNKKYKNDIRFRKRSKKWSFSEVMMLICLVVVVDYFLIGISAWFLNNVPDAHLSGRMTDTTEMSSLSKMLTIYLLLFVSPITEELLFRHCIYNIMKSSSHWFVAMIVSSLMFAAMHGTKLHLITGMLFGMFAVILYEYFGRQLSVTVLAHMCYNGLSVIVDWLKSFVNMGWVIVFLLATLSILFKLGYDANKTRFFDNSNRLS